MFSFSRPIQILFGKSKIGSVAVIEPFILKFSICKTCFFITSLLLLPVTTYVMTIFICGKWGRFIK